jgi:hypothetical protein
VDTPARIHVRNVRLTIPEAEEQLMAEDLIVSQVIRLMLVRSVPKAGRSRHPLSDQEEPMTIRISGEIRVIMEDNALR